MMNGMLLDDNMSNITSASNEDASISSGKRNEFGRTNFLPQQQSFTTPDQPPTGKRKRNLPGNPDPEAEVVALSPQTLMATNRFVCEICNKGFKRDQNLQLHRRGHNLPWKLKQKDKQEQIKKKVYVCPETTCVHHDPSRALGDLTGIKKHFFRKHGEKKWKCEKCSKRYAVQTDWKAHFKICGTREYRCDCGTIFSRRDSFITHRAFCDALAEENAAMANMTNAIQPNPLLSSNPYFSLHPSPLNTELQESQNSHFALPPWLSTQTNPNTNPMDQIYSQNPNQFMSATLLLQKAAQMGVTFSKPQQTHDGQTVTSSSGLFFSTGLVNAASSGTGNMIMPRHEGQFGPTHFEMGGNLPSFEEAFGGILDQKMPGNDFQEAIFSKTGLENSLGRGRDKGLTRDFLSLRVMPQGGFPTMADHQINLSPSYNQNSQNQTSWQD